MSDFELDPRLAGDSVALSDIDAIHVRAMANAPWPWLVLIPRHPEAVELFDLPPAISAQLWALAYALGPILKREFAGDKLNYGALGNVVSQLHLHLIVRQVGDRGWPSPVWGRNEPELAPKHVAERVLRLQHCLRLLVLGPRSPNMR